MSGGGGLLLTVFSFFSPPAWGPRAFLILGVLCLFYASYRAWLSEYKRAEKLSQKSLEFVRVNNVKPFIEEIRNDADMRVLCMRVGLRNLSGVEIPQVRLILEACDPDDYSGAIHPEHELQPMGKPQGTMSVAIPPHGTVIVDVAREVFTPGETLGTLCLCYAQKLQNELRRRDNETYKIVLRAESAGPARRCSLELGGRLAWRLDCLTVLS